MANPVQPSTTQPLAPTQQPRPADVANDAADDQIAEANRQTSDSVFKAYLDRTSISVLQKAQDSLEFDPVQDIKTKSIYKDSGDSTLA